MTGSRLSINRWTCRTTPVEEFLRSAVAGGVESVGLWREDVEKLGTQALRRRTDELGLRVSSLCRGGFLTASADADRTAALDDNRRAIDEAAALGAPTLVLVAGGVDRADKDIAGARERVAEGVAAIAPHAEQAGVTLSLEPLHPMFAADRAVVSTIDQALDIAEASGSPAAGVVVDTYHVWWDPYLPRAIERAASTGRLFAYQVCDWNLPLAAEPLFSRGYMGDGYIDFPAITRMVAATGYTGDVEVEIFNEDVWADPVHVAVRTIRTRYEELVAPHL
ncbi:sugar phosphate isomerase/epimerase family protein [Brachybacterium phenoliresistens]|uniref:sugar phosphate isomerase/epimerase family protein n=1 Tax=Brachybacterium phenoliresistens TaxID=396014 RepID=UPI0031CF19FA